MNSAATMYKRSLNQDCYLELKHITVLHDQWARCNDVDVGSMFTVPGHCRSSRTATDTLPQCAAWIELPRGFVQPLERLVQAARRDVHPTHVHVVQGPPKTIVVAGGLVAQALPPA